MKTYNTELPQKILMTSDSVGGVWNYSVDLCRLLGEHDITVILAVLGKKLNEIQHKEIQVLSNVVLYESSYKLEWMENPWEDIKKAATWLMKISDKHKPDLVHLNNYAFGALDWKIPVITTAHSDVYSWWKYVKGDKIPDTWKTYHDVVSRCLGASDFVIYPSAFMKREIEEAYGSHFNGKVIYNSRSSQKFSRRKKEQFVFSIGRVWDEAKNLKLLVDVSSDIKVPVLIAGDNLNPSGSTRVPVTNDVEYLGIISSVDTADYLSRAFVFVHPAKYEPFGLAVLEAALSGCALVLSDIPSMHEIWGDNALYINPVNPETLVEAIDYLIENNEERRDYGQRAMHHAQKYSEEKMISKYLTVYKSLIKNKHAKLSEKI